MPFYDALITVKVTREYIIRLETQADNIDDARDRLTHDALGMTGKQIATLANSTDPESTDEGEERTVTDVYGIEEITADEYYNRDESY